MQAHRIVKQLPTNSIVMADASFGIYSVAHHTTLAGHDFLFRLIKKRFKSLRRKAELIDKGPTHQTHHLLWRPSANDRRSNPDLPKDASIEVVLHDCRLRNKEPQIAEQNRRLTNKEPQKEEVRGTGAKSSVLHISAVPAAAACSSIRGSIGSPLYWL